MLKLLTLGFSAIPKRWLKMIRCPVEEIGKYSVTPSTKDRITTSNQLTNAISLKTLASVKYRIFLEWLNFIFDCFSLSA
jgi:hypothetical protein